MANRRDVLAGETSRRRPFRLSQVANWPRLLWQVRVPDSAGRNAPVSPLCGSPGGHSGLYSAVVPRLGGAPPCPPGSHWRRRHLASGTSRGHGAGGRGGMGSLGTGEVFSQLKSDTGIPLHPKRETLFDDFPRPSN